MRPYGRFIGLHHLGAGEARDVDLLKGVNMSIRRRYFPCLRFDEHLRGNGAEPHEDWALSLAVRQVGFRVIYDPAIWVDHFEGERIGVDQRSDRTGQGGLQPRVQPDVRCRQVSDGRRRAMAHVVYAVLVGSRNAPGIVSFNYRLIQREFGYCGKCPQLCAARQVRRDKLRMAVQTQRKTLMNGWSGRRWPAGRVTQKRGTVRGEIAWWSEPNPQARKVSWRKMGLELHLSVPGGLCILCEVSLPGGASLHGWALVVPSATPAPLRCSKEEQIARGSGHRF